MTEIFGRIKFPGSSGSIFADGALEFKDNIVTIPIPLSQSGQPQLDTQNDSIVGAINENRADLTVLQGKISISGLEDTNVIVEPEDGDALVFNKDTSLWEASGVVKSVNGLRGDLVLDLNSLNDVDTSTIIPTSGDTLVFNGNEWEPADISVIVSGASSLPVDQRNADGDIIPNGSGFDFGKVSPSPSVDPNNIWRFITGQNLLIYDGGNQTAARGNAVRFDTAPGVNKTTIFTTNFGFANACHSMYQGRADYIGNTIAVVNERAATNAYSFQFMASNGFGGDVEHMHRGDGVFASDGGTTSPADYAEYFECLDPSGYGPGYLVSHTSDERVKLAHSGSHPVGVVSARPALVGDAAWSRWHKKYLTTDFGDYQLDASGHRVLNPGWNSGLTYVPREQRPEWVSVGLLGKLWVRTLDELIQAGDYVTIGVSGMVTKAIGHETHKWRVLASGIAFDPQKGYGTARILFK